MLNWIVIEVEFILNKSIIIDINSGFEKEYEEIMGDDSYYFFVLFFFNLFFIELIVKEVIMNCFVFEIIIMDSLCVFIDVCKFYYN